MVEISAQQPGGSLGELGRDDNALCAYVRRGLLQGLGTITETE